MSECIFPHDNNVKIKLIEDNRIESFVHEINDEKLFRQINTFLINNNIIKNNIIDLGSWMGDNSIPWAKNVKGVVYAIDPSPNNCEFIVKMCELNNINNIKVLQTAISDKNEILSTNYELDHCSFVWEYYINPKNEYIDVNAVSLDFLFEKNIIENVGYIHLDVEGMEYKVLQGASNIIDTCRPIITYEQHLTFEDYSIIFSYLKNKNYKVFLIDETLEGSLPSCRNSIAFPNEVYSDKLIDDIHKYLNKENLLKYGENLKITIL
jgi:FkbM family methyltransferase